MSFYAIERPSDVIENYIYGALSWEYEYPVAEWVDEKIEVGAIICPVSPGHQRGDKRTGELYVRLGATRVGDFHWTSYSECMVTERVLDLFREAGFTGFDVRP